jgi:hypothetical protein
MQVCRGAGVATGWTVPGAIPGRGKIFVYSKASRPVPGLPAAFSQGVKRPGREADHSRPSTAEVKNGGAIPPHPHTFSCRRD